MWVRKQHKLNLDADQSAVSKMDVDADMKRSDDERGPSKPRGERDRRDSVRERERDRERRDRSRAFSPSRLRVSTLIDLPIARRRGDHWEGDDRRNDVRFFSLFFSLD